GQCKFADAEFQAPERQAPQHTQRRGLSLFGLLTQREYIPKECPRHIRRGAQRSATDESKTTAIRSGIHCSNRRNLPCLTREPLSFTDLLNRRLPDPACRQLVEFRLLNAGENTGRCQKHSLLVPEFLFPKESRRPAKSRWLPRQNF